jgi:hypothetical protein
LLDADGLHLSPAGQDALASMIAGALGRPPRGSDGACLPSPFDDDEGGQLAPLPPTPDRGRDDEDLVAEDTVTTASPTDGG